MTWFEGFISSATDVGGLWSANRKLRAQLVQIDTHPAFEDIRKLDIENLKALAATETQRSKDLDDKLSKLTAVLSVALTISGVVTKMVADGMPSSALGTLAVLLLFLAMVFFFFGALVGFGGLRPKPKFGYGGTYLRILAEGGDKAEAELKGVVSSFQVANAIQANYGSAAVDLIRNGIVTFAIGIALSTFVPPAPKPGSVEPVVAPQPTVPSPLQSETVETAPAMAPESVQTEPAGISAPAAADDTQTPTPTAEPAN